MSKIKANSELKSHSVVSHEVWLKARKAFLKKEKEFTKLRDQLNRQRRELPWEKVEKQYIFEGPEGRETLIELFEGKSQLVVWHFMFGPDWKEGCSHCSFWADTFNGNILHLRERDTTMIAISQAPLKKLSPSRNAWVGISNGCHPPTRISTSISMLPLVQRN